MIAGIDGIHLTTKDFQIKSINNLKQSAWKQSASGEIGAEAKILLADSGGEIIRANKLYNNSQSIGKYDISPYGLLIHFNPSKAFHEYNLISTGKELNYLTKALQAEAKSIGIALDIHSMNVSRLDLTKQATMAHDVSQYAPAFRLLQAKRATKKEYPSGYYFHNKKRECIFYDKAAEAAIDEINFMRGEVKYKDTKTVKRATGLQTLTDILSATPLDLTGTYNRHLIDNVFCRKSIGTQALLSFSDEIDVMRSFMKQHRRGAWKEYICHHSIDEVLTQFGSIETFVSLWAEAGYKRRQLFKMKSEIKQMINTKAFIDGRRKKLSPTALLDEVYQKFAA